jgi:hypothetical protein
MIKGSKPDNFKYFVSAAFSAILFVLILPIFETA